MPERALVRVDTLAIERNCRVLKPVDAELCAVVKADGYGHGAEQAARAALSGGASWIAVATAREAVQLRERGVTARLLVMGALTRADAALAAGADADVVTWTPELLEMLPGQARVHVKLDSGMGRLGTKDPQEALALCDRIAADERLELAGLMTHFATADERGDDHFPAQLERFGELVREVRSRH